jgi:hypothetical protein
MSLASPNYLLWFVFVLLLVGLGAAALSLFRRPAKAARRSRRSGDMLLERLQQANAQLSDVVQRENQALKAVTDLPEGVGPLQAERALREATQGWSVHDRQALMLHGWEVQKRPQALAALAGLALADLPDTHSLTIPMLYRALNEGAPPLLGQLVDTFEDRWDALDRLFQSHGIAVLMERAAGRIGETNPDIALRLVAMAERILPRALDNLKEALRSCIADLNEREEGNVLTVAGELAQRCPPRFPELAQQAHAALDGMAGIEAQTIAHLRLDQAILHHFHDAMAGLRGFDFDGALDRLCKAIMAENPATSQAAAGIAADLLSDYFYDRETYRAQLRAALDHAIEQHGLSSDHDWLATELDESNGDMDPS